LEEDNEDGWDRLGAPPVPVVFVPLAGRTVWTMEVTQLGDFILLGGVFGIEVEELTERNPFPPLP